MDNNEVKEALASGDLTEPIERAIDKVKASQTDAERR